ncbi:uncharacterized protein EURHEDRAFT_189337 [Aspergillus ruber CBS 135680]|uniref:Uncharacterized protein n=1 Tax=Aspergillus ruber (strain CBS 135680) TaxID=1388766 RepID=A0A017S7Q5_ASPRC|nr:uncharacterized protein EURHEDRAFT_189337 [Aspergillus ruber CBS 135680]EYE92644.1 hypothetical protein EURHEDRAFT_189337 [Aspergillus ruber CBS 135680]
MKTVHSNGDMLSERRQRSGHLMSFIAACGEYPQAATTLYAILNVDRCSKSLDLQLGVN